MDIIFGHPTWSYLITKCVDVERAGGNKTPEEVIREDGTLDDTFGIIRWGSYVKEKQVARVQTTAQHMLSTSSIIEPTIVIAFKQAGGKHDEVTLKRAIDQHDIPEIECFDRGVTQDKLYQSKCDDDEVDEHDKFIEIHEDAPKGQLDELYRAYLLQFVSKELMSLPVKAKDIMSNHDPNNSSEILLFDAIERVGYLVYAFEQLRHGHRQIAVDTLNFQGPHLDRLANKLPGLADLLWSSDISQTCLEYVQDMAIDYPNLLEHNKEVWVPEQCPNAL